jgi:hypothetical protein
MTYSEINLKTLFERIDEVLFYMWDPLRMSYEPACRDEYTSYVDDILNILIQKISAEEISQQVVDQLMTIWQVAMYQDADRAHCEKVSKYLLNVVGWVLEGEVLSYTDPDSSPFKTLEID